MQIEIIAINSTKISYIDLGVEEYIGRIKHYCAVDLKILPTVKNASKMNREQVKQGEAEILLKQDINPQTCFLLDEKGREFTSVGFSKEIEKMQLAGQKKIIFIIGGAFGFAPSVYQRFPNKIAVSQMTFSHQMIRLILTEQIYRAFTIIKGEKYHH